MGWLESRPVLLAIQLLFLLHVPELKASGHWLLTFPIKIGTSHCPGPYWVSWRATCYLIGKEPKTREEAEKACHKESKISKLLVIRDSQEQDAIGKMINAVLGKEGDKREFWLGLKKGDGELSWKVSGKKEKGGVWKSWPNYIFGCRMIIQMAANYYNDMANYNLTDCQNECFIRRNTFNCNVIEHITRDSKVTVVDPDLIGTPMNSQGLVRRWSGFCRLRACRWDATPKRVSDRTGWEGEKIKSWSYVPNAFENWGDSEPSNNQGKNCVKMKRGGGEQGPKGFILDWDKFTYSKWPVDWYWMQEQCKAKHLYICERGEEAIKVMEEIPNTV